MALKLKIKKGDNVTVVSGAGKGHSGTVLDIKKSSLQIKVSGHNMQTHFDKENGISQKEGFVDYSNVKADTAAKRQPRKKAAKKAEAKKA